MSEECAVLQIMKDEIGRDHQLIAQANTRTLGLLGATGAIASTLTLPIVFMTTVGYRPNLFTLAFLLMAVLAMVKAGGAVGRAAHPKMKGMPRDDSLAAYRQRVARKAANIHEETAQEGLRLQEILHYKEENNRDFLKSLAVMTAAFLLALASLFAPLFWQMVASLFA